ncbi:MAG TPA: hypothetical protein DCG19_01590 [Cryomorphaceae bacterium]|nr:hypothetical protein [Owenweeksia sp.]HAD96063.1 hypothetical protein [Cryomorphaceae bacterium]HBF18986.1 hypothetical protein [Cryomorphaceae bacterium]|tara:strand:+ start:264 stop:473 length:210 start_codon:yes stop_codon:yes gene_type:complete
MSDKQKSDNNPEPLAFFIKKTFNGVEQLVQLLAESEDAETRKQIHRSLRSVLRKLKMALVNQAENAGKD